MRVTTRSEYALLALLYLARHTDEGFVPLSRVAEAQAIPLKYLEQLVLILHRAGYLASRKGQHGGHRLARPASEIHLAEVFRLLDGALAPTDSASTFFYRPTPIEREERLLGLLKEIRDFVAIKLESKTLADFV
jgi:Rrf2 family transcriptional regulator, cysteine metabolism repressor